MVLFNYSTRELTAKIVYYGPGLCGKTTNLQYIHSTLPDDVKGKMLSLATKTDRTLFFDFLPIDLGEIRGMKTRIQLYTVPGQVFYNETRKLVLKGADGIIFVADSQAAMLGANVESFRNLEENLKGHGLKLSELPHAIQFNKRDLPKLSTIEELNDAVNRYNAPFYESVATTGIGVQDTLKAITKLVLLHLTRKYDPKAVPDRAAQVAVPPPQVHAPVAAAPPAPAQTLRQRPSPHAAAPATTRSIPLSSFKDPLARTKPEPVAAPPCDAAATTRLEPVDDAMFGPQEIDALVSEVGEADAPIDLGAADAIAVAPPVTPALDDETFDLGEPDFAEPASEPSVAFDAPAERHAPVDLTFEVDHRSDPDWEVERAHEPPRPAAVRAPAAPVPVAPVAYEPPAVASEPAETWDLGTVDEPALEDAAPPALSEPLRESDLFDDPSVEVARLAAGERREILIPVELGERAGKKRFTLSIQLRLDPVD